MDRKEALELGLKTYFTGKPCPAGHIGERLTRNGSCVACIPCLAKKYNAKLNTPTYITWRGMLRRARHTCLGYDKPVGFHPPWASYEQFVKDVGERPEGMVLDREKSHIGYFPGNVRWVTPDQNVMNRRNTLYVEVENRVVTLRDHCRVSGVNYEWGRRHLKPFTIGIDGSRTYIDPRPPSRR